MTGPKWTLSDDSETVTIEFPSTPPAALKLGVEQVDDILKNLSHFRANMKPGIPDEHPVGAIKAFPDPRWSCEPDLMHGHSLLHLQAGGFGWLHFLFPPREAKHLGEILINQANTKPEEPDPKAIS